nr:bacterial Ig-like domain-containing protein [Bacillus sp. FJAT-50079]
MKTDYLVNQELDLAGLDVTAVYSDDTKATLGQTDYIVTGFDSSVAGVNSITINYNGATATIDLTINPLTVEDLTIKYYPAKTTYYIGDKFDPEGFVIEATYDNGETVELSEDLYEFTVDERFTTAGTKEIIVTSTETPSQKASFNVTVSEAQLTELEIRKQPAKTLYYLDDELDLDGMVIYAKYDDGAQVRLMKDEYTVSELDTTTPGEKTVTLTHKNKTATLHLTVKIKELTGITVLSYPKTTYTVGDVFQKTGLVVAKKYDNGDTDKLVENDYSLNVPSFKKAGTYDVAIIPADTSIEPIVLKVTVTEAVQYEWKSIRFGQSSSNANNTITVKDNGTVEIVALEGGGKVTGDHDGISFYYTEIDATEDNFELSATIDVKAYAKNPHDGQESFGIMARDAIGTAGDSSVFASNIAAIGGFSGGTREENGTQLFVRTGVESPDGAGSKGIQKIMLENKKPSGSYKLTLKKTNSGFVGSVNDGKEEILFEPDILNVQDDKIYVGFYTARLATIEVSDIEFTVTKAATDAPKVDPPQIAIEPAVEFVSLDKASLEEYGLRIQANVNGTVTVKQGDQVIATDLAVEVGKAAYISTTIKSGLTNFSATFLPDDTQYLTSYDKIVRNFTVEMRSYEGDIYVAPEGTNGGTGTVASPLDLDTAIEFVKPGQKIIVQDGVYKRNSMIDIKKYNDGTADAKKYLVAADGAQPVIDFDKKSEGVVLSGYHWHIKGLDFARSAGNTKGFTIGGSFNTVENSRFYENGDTGLQISRTDVDEEDKTKWPSYNLILNSTSFDNRDPSDNNADGFAAKLTSGYGNVFRGTIAHNNIDDGWDLYTKAGTGAIGAVVIEDSIAYNNGFLTDGTVGSGDKNGFKLGGEGIHVPHVIRNSIAFGNGAYGFTSNSNPGVIAENNIGFNNTGGNLSFTTYGQIQTDFKIDGFVSYQKDYKAKDSYPAGLASDRNFMFDGTKSVNLSGVVLTDANFESLDPVVPYERDADGNIIWGSFLKLIGFEAEIDLSELEQLIDATKAIENNGKYTESSFAELQQAIVAAEKALETIETEAALNEALEDLQAAIDGLVEVDLDPDTAVIDSLDDFTLNENGVYGYKTAAKSISISKEVLNEMVSGGSIQLENESVKVMIPVSLLQIGKDITFTFGEVLETYAGAVSELFDFTLMADGEPITDFAEPITLIFTVDADKVNEWEQLRVVYIDENGKWKELIEPESISKESNEVVAKVTHFSIYGVFEIDPEQALDISELEALIAAAKAIQNNGKYTDSSYQALQDAISAAESALEKIDSESALNAEIANLQAAIDGLEEVKPTPPIGDEDDDDQGKVDDKDKDDTGKNKDQNGDKSGEQNKNRDQTIEKNKGTTDGSKLPNTATTTYNMLLVGAILLLLGATSLFIVKKRRS